MRTLLLCSPFPVGDTQAPLRQSSPSSATKILFGKVWKGWTGKKELRSAVRSEALNILSGSLATLIATKTGQVEKKI